MPQDSSNATNVRSGRLFTKLVWLTGILLAAGLLMLGAFYLVAANTGAGRGVAEAVPLGSLYPAAGMSIARMSSKTTQRGQAAIDTDASQELRCTENGRPAIRPRVAFARLLRGKDIENVNRTLCSLVPWKRGGSTHLLHPGGDYDFAETEFVTLLYVFGEQPDKLYPETVRHIVEYLLIEDGSKPQPYAPRTLGFAPETENHILMKEGARYLRNQWRFERGTPDQRANPEYDNSRNGLGRWLVEHLQELRDAGFHEFNSIPYLSYTMRALLNLEAFPRDPEIRLTARHILDAVNWQYALGSLDLRRCAPFRRQPHRAEISGLQEDTHTPFMLVWTDSPLGPPQLRPREETMAEIMPYRPPKAVLEWVLHKPESYFVRFGHGKRSTPEVYSGGPDYLISAGGVARGHFSMIAARPTSLFLHDGAKDLRDCFNLTGKGRWQEWNNTGVCSRFACTNGTVNVPKTYTVTATAGSWSVYNAPSAPGLLVAVYNRPGVALLALFPDEACSPQDLAEKIAHANPNQADLSQTFNRPGGGSVSYDVNAPRDKWVITAIDGQAVDRDFDRWPQMDGEGPKITFD